MIPVHDTPFVATSTVLPDHTGAEQMILLYKATYDVSERGDLTPAAVPDPIVYADTFVGDAGVTSIVNSAEVVPPLPSGTDAQWLGHAVAPKSGTRELDVSFRVGPVLKRARVFGTRVWAAGGASASCTTPEPFERVPLIYENGFGGTDDSPDEPKDWESEPKNPIGRGFRATRTRATWDHSALPNIEHPEHLIRSPTDRPPPVGFGPIGRHWDPRVQYIGTYDQRWLDERMPLLPEDFDDRFHHSVSPDQIVAGFVQGDEPVEIVGCRPSGALVFALPRLAPHIRVNMFLRTEDLDMRCESVTVDTDRMKVMLVYKAMFALKGDLMDIRTLDLTVEGFAA